MARYYNIIENGYVSEVGIGLDGEEISKAEYEQLYDAIMNPPEAPAGHEYKLKSDLTWELHEMPVVEPDPDEEISDAEALNIILGVSE